jgi:putative restriction endonuclease
MPKLTKAQLLDCVEVGLRAGGWDVLYLSAKGDHPGRYRVYRDEVSLTARIYIWNITHGGGPRSAQEYRIQITGLSSDRFDPEIGGKTLILGWWPNDQIFAGFDYRRHSGLLGGSPSMQIGLPALQSAVGSRFASHLKSSGEVAIAFRPDFIGTYIENLDALHDTALIPDEARLLRRLAAEPDEVEEAEIESVVDGPRKWAVIRTRRALRALDFSERVLSAYRNQCAMCGTQLRLLDGAHILPVAEPESTDETANGVALCALHHRAYDRGLVTFDSSRRVLLNEERVQELRDSGLDGQIRQFQSNLREVIHVPAERIHRPKSEYVERANALRGWRR